MSLLQLHGLIFFFFLGTITQSVFSRNTSSAISTKYDINQAVVNRIITVDKRGQGDFTTVQEAVNAVPNDNKQWILIHVKAGIYNEKVTIDKDKQFIFMKGESSKKTIITHEEGGDVIESTTFKMFADNFVARDISFVNTYDRPLEDVNHRISWAPAVLIAGDKMSFYRCGFVSVQDTISDFKGRHYFQSCYIEGAIDFIWGNGQSFFKYCNINATTWKLNKGTPSYLTAQGRESPSQTTGFVFHTCAVLGSGPAYLGRAFRNYSRVLYYNTLMTEIVAPLGWDAWQNIGHEDLITYSEVRCSGIGSDKSGRVKWEKRLRGQKLYNLISVTEFINQDRWLQKQPH